jgi:hypothetical protein
MRVFRIENTVHGVVAPIAGRDKDFNVVIRNTEYWVGPDIIIPQAEKARIRAVGRHCRFPRHPGGKIHPVARDG